MSVPHTRSYTGTLESEPQSADTAQPVEQNNSDGLEVDSGWKAFLRAESEYQPSEDVNTPAQQPEMTDYFDGYSPSQPIMSASPESQQQTEVFQQFPHYGRVEVVLDDGTSQYRSVSLSTLPDLDLVRSRRSQYNASENTPLLGQGHRRKYGDGASSSDSDSDDEEIDTPLTPFQRWIQQYFPIQNLTVLTLSSAQESIIKCCIAYALACMFTWIPALNALLGDSATSSHMIATASVWFHPAKTLGGMVEAISVAFLYFIFGVIISCLSMLSTLALYERDAANWAHFVSLVFWLGGSTFLIQLSKVYFDRPSFNTGASISALILFTVIVKEGSESAGEFSTDRIEGISLAVGIGLLISVVTCFLFLPKSAGRQLQDDIAKSLASFRLLLKLLTKTFLLDTDLPQFMANDNLQQAIKDHHASFTAMEKSLIEAKLEIMQLDTWSKCKDYGEVVDSLQRLAQHVGGLRSSCGVQFELLKEEDLSPEVLEEAQRQRRSVSKRMERLTRKMSSDPKAPEARKKPGTEREETYNIRAGYTRRKFQDEMQKEIRRRSTIKASPPKSNMHTIVEDVEDEEHGAFPNSRPKRPADEVSAAQAEGRLGSVASNSSLKDASGLIEFLAGIGPSMKSLGYTCKRTLMHLERLIKPQETSLEWILHHCCLKTRTEPTDTPSLQQLHSNLAKAIELFENTHEEAIAAMYKQQLSAANTPTNDTAVKVDGLEDVRVSQPYETGPGEQVFLVYYFVFCFEQFARELLVLVEEVRDLYESEEEQYSSFDFLTSPMALFRDRSQEWKRQVGKYRQSRKTKHADEMQHIADAITASTLQVALPITNNAKFIPNQRHMPETLHTPVPGNKISRYIRYFWSYAESLKSYTVKYALKTSLAIMLVATPAFIDSTKAIFREYRMEWCLITASITLNC
ncbi:hypothetical protein BZG36_03050 [Bifiguratus adelaidae]|uniref:Putative ER transporter 6TM N-terminal domain-containing protein n=1 Tax=Bifiguratus adelaidae TaxID=1938954 RepID=A0A261XYZ3_9FUNG|nr:hypothetical protein BZG36_03050 [Bifiguratus adelaidae]